MRERALLARLFAALLPSAVDARRMRRAAVREREDVIIRVMRDGAKRAADAIGAIYAARERKSESAAMSVRIRDARQRRLLRHAALCAFYARPISDKHAKPCAARRHTRR